MVIRMKYFPNPPLQRDAAPDFGFAGTKGVRVISQIRNHIDLSNLILTLDVIIATR
jgi:hypothetical protein